jgi:hypothetical protein
MKKEYMDRLMRYMTPLKLMMRSVLYAHLIDGLKGPEKELFSTSERNIASYIRSSLEIFKNIDMPLSQYQVDTEYGRVGLKNASKRMRKSRVIPDIIVHKRGKTVKEIEEANYLCIKIKKINGFNGDVEAIKNKKKRTRLEADLDKLMFFRGNENFRYKYGVSIVISDTHTIYFKINDEDFMRCSIRQIPSNKQKRLIEIVERAVAITREHSFVEKVSFQAKVKRYEKEIDQIVTSCLA